MVKRVYCDGTKEYELFNQLRARAGEVDRKVTETVARIIEDVRREGDAAVLRYTRQFDRLDSDDMEVPRDEINDALTEADPAFIESLLNAMENIAAFHQRQKRESFIDAREDGVLLGQKVRPLKKVGVYVPGGRAAYPSTVLMDVVPAKIAGVGEIVMVTPPGRDGRANPDILAAAAVAGVDRVFLAGGAQAVAALAFGTAQLPRVDKIVGPGNVYVATAKRLLYGTVDIDMIAGPSEILIVADDSARPDWVAADMMSQCEHDPLASAVLVTTSAALADAVEAELARQMPALSRRDVIEQSLGGCSAIFVCDGLARALDIANEVAPEHLELLVREPMTWLGRVENAGSIFLGPWSPEPLGDYFAGPNHVLPTSGTARFFSPLSVDSFVKRSSFICYTEDALRQAAPDIVRIAGREGLTAHAHAVEIRFEQEES